MLPDQHVDWVMATASDAKGSLCFLYNPPQFGLAHES